MASTYAVMALSAVALHTIRAPDDSLDEKLERLCRIRDEAAPVLPWYSSLSAAILAFAWAHTGRINRAEKVLRHLTADDPYLDSPLVRDWLNLANAEISRAIPLSQLSAAELRVWDYLLGRLTLSEIADSLCLSRETVKTHTGSIYRKLGVASRREALDLADEWGVGQGEYA